MKTAFENDPTYTQMSNLQSNLKRLLNLLMQVKTALPDTPVLATITKTLASKSVNFDILHLLT